MNACWPASLRILFARHGESVWNAAGRWQGQADPPLSERGRAQARELATHLSSQRVELLATSDLGRARETAEIVGRSLGLEPRVHPALRELDAGIWSGLSGAEVAERWPDELERLKQGDVELRVGGGESFREVRERVTAALRKLLAELSAGPLLVVAHLGTLRALVPGARLGHGECVELGTGPPLVETGPDFTLIAAERCEPT